ncbi:hypothetical protein [Lentiprolixibacter aurantiacus]|uniref:Uncharacterized protein n=1 Tax=Lentiprolixibacter aurantiacus TaxID=2993939 RepID=A0AAE3SLV5_9FLAO|nr:hypothetical protein [Lentiprolixibacter aurantiacus]MCX2718092.1 hypothetical protein [Lentiprolixibacter aurantiacus]
MSEESSRRLFFKQLITGSAGLYLFPNLQACKNKETSQLVEVTGPPPFSVWEEMISVLEQSPDHWISRFNNLIISKNPEAMIDFVREDIGMIPSDEEYFRNIGNQIIYGPSGTLRCGLATPRGKAELLKNMLEKAGFEARVVYETVDLSESEVKKILFSDGQSSFDPPLDDSKVKEWHTRLGVSEPKGQVEWLNSIVDQSEGLGKVLLDKIPENFRLTAERGFRFSAMDVPGVIYSNGTDEIFVHLFDPSVSSGSYHPSNTQYSYREADPAIATREEIQLSLKGINALNPSEEINLLEGKWNASELVGQQLKLFFLNNMTFPQQLANTISDISTFTPCMAVQNLYEDAAYMEKASVLGKPIGLGGEPIMNDYRIQFSNEGESSRLQANVTSLECRARTKAYPTVALEIYPRDSSGKIIEGMNPSDFNIVDNGKTVCGWMQSNHKAPKIMLLHDTSFSMPEAYYGEGIQVFLENLERVIHNVYPKAIIQRQETDSGIYSAHLKAALSDNDLILYATDGDNDDQFNPEDASIYKSGPPTIYLNVRESSTALLSEITENTFSEFIQAEDQTKTIERITKIIEETDFPPYIFMYNSNNSSIPHEVHVSLKGTDLKAETQYTFPAQKENLIGDRLISLILDVKIGDNPIVRRVLAGWNPLTEPNMEPNIHMANAVHEMLMGGVTLAFEREGASESIRLTEYLKYLLTHKDWFQSYQQGKVDQAIAAIDKGGYSYPQQFLSMMQPIREARTKKALTIPLGYRIGVLKFKPGLFSENTELNFDYLPTSKYVTFAVDKEKSFEETLKKTAQLALLENATFTHSTLSKLKNAELALNKITINEETYSAEHLESNYHYFQEKIFRGALALFDKEAKQKAFWQIDEYSGELYGILPDGSGGGGNSVMAQLQELKNVVKEYEKIVALMNLGMGATGTGNFPIGVVANYSVTLVKLYSFATEAIIIMDASGIDKDVQEAIAQFACNVYKDILYVSFGPVGEAMGGIENLITALGGNYSFIDCPN